MYISIDDRRPRVVYVWLDIALNKQRNVYTVILRPMRTRKKPIDIERLTKTVRVLRVTLRGDASFCLLELLFDILARQNLYGS